MANFLTLQYLGSSPNTGISDTGWDVGTNTAPNYGLMAAHTYQSTFQTSPLPNSLPDSITGDCFRTQNPLLFNFTPSLWQLIFVVGCQNDSGASGRLNCRIYKSSSSDGTSAIELTNYLLVGQTVNNLQLATYQNATVYWSAPDFILNNEYLFVQLAFEITTASANAASDVAFVINSACGIRVKPPMSITTTCRPGSSFDCAITYIPNSGVYTGSESSPVYFLLPYAVCTSTTTSTTSTSTTSTTTAVPTSSTTSTTAGITSSTTSTTAGITSSTTSTTAGITSSTTSTTAGITSSTTSTTAGITSSTTSTTAGITSSTTSTTSTSTTSTSTTSTTTTSTTTTSTTTTTTAYPFANAILFQTNQENSNYYQTIIVDYANSIINLGWGNGYVQLPRSDKKYQYQYSGSILPNSFNGWVNPNGTILKSISFSGSYNSINISNYNSLQSFYLSDTSSTSESISSINLLSNTNLNIISIVSNTITNVNATALSNLQNITAASPYLASVTTTGCTNLTTFFGANSVYGFGGPSYVVTSYDFSTNTNLIKIRIINNAATSFPVLTNNTKLVELYLNKFNLASTSFVAGSSLYNLLYLDLSHNNLTSIDLTACPKVGTFIAADNNISSVVLNGNSIFNLNLSNNSLSSITLPLSLKNLDLSHNNISSIYLQDSTNSLITLYINNNNISTFSVSYLEYLQSFSCANNNISTLNLSTYKRLKDLDASFNNLTSITLPQSPVTYLTQLILNNNNFTTSTVNSILAYMVATLAGKGPGTIALQGQTPAAPPTGQGILNRNTLVNLGWKVTTD